MTAPDPHSLAALRARADASTIACRLIENTKTAVWQAPAGTSSCFLMALLAQLAVNVAGLPGGEQAWMGAVQVATERGQR